MRILHVVPSYIPAYRYGGPIYSVHGLCKALASHGHDVHVFTTNVDGEKDSDVPLETPVDIDGVKVWYFPSKFMRRLYWSPPMKRALGREINKFDLLHLHSIFLWPTWAAASAARRARVPYIVAPRGMLVKELIRRKNRLLKKGWIDLVEKRNLEDAAVIHVTSSIEAKDVARFRFKLKKVVVVHNGVEIHNSSLPPLTLRGGAGGGGVTPNVGSEVVSDHIKEIISKGPYLLFLGRINWKKGLDRLIRTIKHVPDIRLIIAGNDEDNYRSRMESLIAENELSERVFFCGPVYNADKFALLENAKVFVLFSYSENFGISVLEAMASKCPVAVTPEVGSAEILRESGAGVVLSGDPAGLARGLNKLLSDPDLLRDMGERGSMEVAARYTWDIVAEQMEEVYGDIRNCGAGSHV